MKDREHRNLVLPLQVGVGGTVRRRACDQPAKPVERQRESACMSESTPDVGQRDSDLRATVIEVLRKRARRVLFVTEPSALLRKAR